MRQPSLGNAFSMILAPLFRKCLENDQFEQGFIRVFATRFPPEGNRPKRANPTLSKGGSPQKGQPNLSPKGNRPKGPTQLFPKGGSPQKGQSACFQRKIAPKRPTQLFGWPTHLSGLRGRQAEKLGWTPPPSLLILGAL